MARKSDTKEIKNKHTSRPVGGAETGTRAERTCVAVVGLRLAECGTNGTLADPVAPHLRTDKLRGPDSEWRRKGQAERRVADPAALHSRTDKPGQTAGIKADRATQGSSTGK